MPKKMSYEELMRDSFTCKILKKYRERGTYVIRRRELKDDDMNDMTLQRRLDRLCKENVLMKVNKKGKSINGGKEAPETYYELFGEHWKVAVKSADLERLREQWVGRMCSGSLTTVYGFDISDFGEDEEDRKRFLTILGKMESLARGLLLLKIGVLRRVLENTYATLDEGKSDPITIWMMKYYAWTTSMAPITGVEPGRIEDFIAAALKTVFLSLSLDQKVSEDEVKKVADDIPLAVALTG
ncbi:MAG: hypothetical protein LN415_09190, partial [Candidatus Thermoplasmatota archaeon]|nr:hypothetical protein [Candidatus Thermoplasmatota archaeon]